MNFVEVFGKMDPEMDVAHTLKEDYPWVCRINEQFCITQSAPNVNENSTHSPYKNYNLSDTVEERRKFYFYNGYSGGKSGTSLKNLAHLA